MAALVTADSASPYDAARSIVPYLLRIVTIVSFIFSSFQVNT